MKILIEFLPRRSEPPMRFEATHIARDELFSVFTISPSETIVIANSRIAFVHATEIPEEDES